MSERTPPTEAELVELVRSIDARAPQRLHRRIDALVAASAPKGERTSHRSRAAPLRLGLASAVALAVIAAVLVASLSGGGSALTLRTAVALTLRPATAPAPAQDAQHPGELAADVEGIAFPYWEDRFGWRSAGARTDSVDGRTVTTVFYARGHQWIGYAIASGSAPSVSGGIARTRGGTVYRLLSEDGARVVTWRRDGHLCVVSGHDVSDATLMALASWDATDTLAA
jgi:hypothetical protein